MIWGVLSWVVLNLHDNTLKPYPGDEEIGELLKENIDQSGVYLYPARPDSDSKEAMEEYEKRHLQGPVFYLFFQREGIEPMHSSVLIKGFIVFLIASLMVTILLYVVKDKLSQYLQRLLFIMGIALFAGITVHLGNWAWFNYSLVYTLMSILDTLIGFTLAGLVIAALIRPGHKYTV